MAISAKCDCGKRIGVADVMAGRTIRCPECGDDVFVPEPAAAPAGKVKSAKKPAATTARPGGRANVSANDRAPGFTISPTIVRVGIVGGVLLVIWATLYFGPWRVGNQWAAISGRANSEVTDVVLFAILTYESQHGGYNPAKPHGGPQTQGDASFIPPMMAFSMPKNIPFIGKTNQGNYRGTYSPSTGEIEAIIETGGFTVGGLVDVHKASGEFRISGREKNGKPEAEVDGKPLKMLWPKNMDD